MISPVDYGTAYYMAQASYSREGLARIDGAHIAIVQGSWHRDLTDMMVTKCSEILLEQGAKEIERHVLPGCLELPLAAQRLARSKKLDAIIAFGIILKGETDHYDVVRDLSIHGLGEVMLREDIPVIIEILPVHKIEHAIARSGDNDANKGIEAALAAIGCISWRRNNPLPS